jgi:hypothetical protein
MYGGMNVRMNACLVGCMLGGAFPVRRLYHQYRDNSRMAFLKEGTDVACMVG